MPPVLSFELSPLARSTGQELVRGRLVRVSRTSTDVLIRLDGGSIVRCNVPFHERVPYLIECVEYCTAFHFAVEADLQRHVVVSYTLVVDPPTFEAQMATTTVAGEAYLLHMLSKLDGCHTQVRTSVAAPVLHAADVAPHDAWRGELMAHQERTASWMRWHEARIRGGWRLAYELAFALPDTSWSVDESRETFTRAPDVVDVHVRGGIVADGTGMGKTATVLHTVLHVPFDASAADHRYGSRATLVVVPINLTSQWMAEIEKFYATDRVKCVCLTQGRHLRAVSMADLLDAQIVLTTVSFMRRSRPYLDLVEQHVMPTVGFADRKLCCSFPSIRAWARAPGREAPILQAVRWARVVVDEIHELVEAPHDLAFVNRLDTDAFWGISATPNMETHDAQYLGCVLRRGERTAHHPHPNLRRRFVDECVRGCATIHRRPELTLRRVRVDPSVHERLRGMSLREAVQLGSQALDAPSRVGFAIATERALRASVLRGPCSAFVRRSALRLVRAPPICSICLDAACTTLTRCGHAYCATCLARHLRVASHCPMCRRALVAPADVTTVVREKAVRKLEVVAEMARGGRDPVIVFVQWKSMMRTLKAVLLAFGLRVVTLEGNMCRRNASLQGFASAGGVLILCMQDSFAGLHLPWARRIIFAHALIGSTRAIADMESQAIARAVRPGQTGTVSVHSVVIADSAEEQLWFATHEGQ